MTVMLPTPDQLRAVADQCGLSQTAEDIASFRGLMLIALVASPPRGECGRHPAF